MGAGNIAYVTDLLGTPDTNRTCDLPLRRGLLYPLSYRGADAILAAGASSLGRCALP